MPAAEPKHPHHCAYCGLPMGAAGFEPEPGRFYCCYGCYLVQGIVGEHGEEGIAAGILARLGVGTFLSMTVMMVSFVLYVQAPGTMSPETLRAFGWVLLLFSTPAMAVMAPPFLRGAWRELRRGRLNMDALIAVGSLSAYGASALHVALGRGPVYFDTATMLLVLVTAGKLLEASAKSNASRVVRGLLALGSRVARRLTDDGEEEVPPEALRVGDRLVVRPGEQVPVDGVILTGASAVQEAAFTGESLPRACGPGDTLYGGSVNTDGLLVLRATGIGEHALLGQMARLVREAQMRRAPVERLAERLSALFIPAVWATAAASAAYWALAHGEPGKGAAAALSVLIVACPCALGLATPLAVSIAIAVAARAGVLLRSGAALERLPRVRRAFLDKTGTLTRGALRLDSVRILSPGETEEGVLAWAATLESASEHPLARAVVAAAHARGLELGRVSGLRAFPGRGAQGTVTLAGETRRVAAGTWEFVRGGPSPPDPLSRAAGEGEPPAEEMRRLRTDPFSRSTGEGWPSGRDEGASAVYVAWNGRVRAALLLADTPRSEAREVVAELSRLGVRATLLSGDREEIARQLAARVGIAEARGACSPPEKVAAIEQARAAGECTAMVGDGINDAPALAAADVGIALAAGTDLAREAGDVVLLGDDLARLPWAIRLARRAYRIIAQNLFWAFGYNAVAVAAAFFGRLHPLLAAVLMLLSSLFVLGNSLRLLRDAANPASPPPSA